VVGDDRARRVDDSHHPLEREPFIRLQVQKWRQSARQPSDTVTLGECPREAYRARRYMGPRAARREQPAAKREGGQFVWKVSQATDSLGITRLAG
jgi:hypothetical protein